MGRIRTPTPPTASFGRRRTRGQTTTYTYDVRGNLVRVDLPDGTVIEYLIDGQDRRVGKKRNGVLEKQWLYKDQLRIAAELDGAGTLVSRFVYASRENVPDFVIRGGSDVSGVQRPFGVAAGRGECCECERCAGESGVCGVWGRDRDWSGVDAAGVCGRALRSGYGLVRFGARDYDPQRRDGGLARIRSDSMAA